MRSYEGLFILNTAGKEEGVREIIDRISAEITALGGQIESVQKMDKRAFARVTSKKLNSGFYANFRFTAPPTTIEALHSRFELDDDVYRVIFVRPDPVTAKPVPAAEAE